ncbi:MAG: MFS transporter [archaeon]|nr:MFS transporter [archaeon]
MSLSGRCRQSVEFRLLAGDDGSEEEDHDKISDEEGKYRLSSRPQNNHNHDQDWFQNLLVFLVYGLVSGLAGGVFYAVGVFAADLKAIEGYSQTGINLVSAIAYAGGAMPLFVSPFIDDGTGDASNWVLSRFTWMALTCLLTAAGFGASALCVVFHPTPLALTTACFFLFGMGSSLNFCVSMPVAQLNMPDSYFPKFNGLVQVSWALSGLLSALGYRYLDIPPVTKLAGLLSLAAIGWLLACAIVVAFMRRMRLVPKGAQAGLPFCRKIAKAARLWFDWRFVCQFSSSLLAFGAAVNLYNNAEAINLSLGGGQQLGESQVSAFFAAALTGRVLAALLSSTPLLELPGGLFGVSAFSCVALAAVHLGAYFYNSPTLMWYWLCCDGVAYGFLWTLMPLTTLHFKPVLVSFEAVYSFFNIASAVGPLVFDLISGSLYDSQLPDGSLYCMGDRCYHLYLLIAACTSFVSLILLIAAHFNPKARGCFQPKAPTLIPDPYTIFDDDEIDDEEDHYY